MATFDEQLATAMVAKIFGSELKTVDDNTLQQSSAGPAAKLDPLSFVTSVQEKKQSDQQRAIEAANREAELLYPLPSSNSASVPFVQPPLAQSIPVQQQYVQSAVETTGFTKEDIQSIRSQLEKVNATLTKMSGMLGKVFATFTEKNKLQ
jgi:hypothetical protein